MAQLRVGRRAFRAETLLAVIFLGSVAARIAVAGLRTTPLYYPDEYIYAALSRSIASTGLPSVRGAALQFPSLLAPYLMAPAWLIGNVSVAYHVVLDLGAVWFSAAVFPAYALARKIGITPGSSLIVALLAILVPDAALATAALTEPYAYPLFLTTVLVAIDAIVAPTRFRQVGVIALMAVLCFARVQFAFVLVVYGVAALVHARGSVRRALRAQPGVAAVMLGGVVSVALVGPGRLVGFYSFPTDPHVLFSTWTWFGLNLFVLAIAAGWVIVPGALVGLASLIRSSDPRLRVFAVFAVAATVALVAQAAYVDAFQHRVHERYTFYAAPLLAVACVWAFEAKLAPRAYALVAYALAIAAILIPPTQSLRAAGSGQSPILLALEPPGGGGSTARIAWAVALAVAAIVVGLTRSRTLVALVLAVVISSSMCVVATRALLRFVPISEGDAASHHSSAFRPAPPGHAALITWAGTDRYTLMKTLFWNPTIDRVLVVGGGTASDGFSSTPVFFRPPVGIVDGRGRAIAGPFAFAPDTTLLAPFPGSSRTSWLRAWPRALILGLDRQDRYLSTVAELLVTSDVPLTVSLQLSSDGGPKSLTFDCATGSSNITVGRAPSWIRINVGTARNAGCRISLTRGTAVERENRIVSGVKVRRFTVSAR